MSTPKATKQGPTKVIILLFHSEDCKVVILAKKILKLTIYPLIFPKFMSNLNRNGEMEFSPTNLKKFKTSKNFANMCVVIQVSIPKIL